MTEKSKKELYRLYMSELVTAMICGLLMYALTDSTDQPLDLRLLLPGVILIFIVLQSAGYWYYRHYQIDHAGASFAWIMPLYSILKKLNRFLFVLYPLFCLYLLVTNPTGFFVTMNIFGLILYVFSIIEHINYYHYSVQLANLGHKVPSELSIELSDYENKHINNK